MLKSWRFWIGLAISAVSLYFAFQGIRLDQVGEALRGMDYKWLVPATAMFLVSYGTRAFRWQLLFSPQKLRLSNVFHALNIGYFLSNILPARLGDVVRAYLLGDMEGVSKARALSTVVVERLFDGLAVVLVLAATAFFVPNIPDGAPQGALGVAAAGIAGIAFLLVLSFHKARGLALLRRIISPAPLLRSEKLWSTLENLVDGFAVLRSPRPVFGVGAWSLAAWGLGGLMFWTMMQAMSLNLALPAAFLVMTVTSLVVVVPSSPGYVGVFHYAATLTLTSVFNVDKSTAFSYAVVMHAFNYIWLIALGVYSIWHEGLSYQRLQMIQAEKPETAAAKTSHIP
ncbi:MAG: flippase-like domain-containing protein [Chloroflexi bacterium]|nr:flippase-like domain-containing protein [Chloroflexota bacterium]